MQTAPIGIFDSGIGGLSVVREVRKRLPKEDILYFADTAFAPYGEKPPTLVRQRSRFISRFMFESGAKAVVLACNTATALAAETLRREFDSPIIAMEPAIKPAAAITRSDVIGVLATAATLGSERYADLRDRHGRQVRVLERVCSQWVELVERGECSGSRAMQQVAADLQPLLDNGVDTLVLGCTHFPFLRPLIEQVAGPAVTLIDPAPAVAAELSRRLRRADLLSGRESGRLHAYCSGDAEVLDAMLPDIVDQEVDVQKITDLR